MISVCAPYWNRRAALHGMLSNYARVYADLLPQMEFVIADDGSMEEPAELPSPGPRCPVSVLQLPRKKEPLNPCVPINEAVRFASSDVIVLTNCEIEHRAPVLPEMLSLLESEDDYVTARCFDARLGWLAGPEVDYSRGGRLPVPEGAHFHFLAMFRRRLWDRAGGFDEDYRRVQACDDNDWLWRLHRAGARFRCTQGVVFHESGTRLRWNLPHGRKLFEQKWPQVLEAAGDC